MALKELENKIQKMAFPERKAELKRKVKEKGLKGWKKISDTKYINKKRKGILYIGNNISSGKPDVSITIDTVKIDGAEFTKTSIYEEFKTKSQALAFAKAYMKKH